MMRKRKVAWAVMAVVPVLVLTVAVGASAGTGKSAATTITVWAHQGQTREVAVLKNAVAAFNASQADIDAKLRFIPEADYTKTIQATPRGDLPDVLEFDGPLMSAWAYGRKLQPITAFVSRATVKNQSPSVKVQNTYFDGKLYGVSMFDSGLALYGNKALLRAAGVRFPTSWRRAWTVTQFTAVLAKLAAKDRDGKVLDVKENYAAEWPTYGFLPIVASTGDYVVKDFKASGNLNNPKVVAAVKRFASWRKYIDPNSDDKAFTAKRVALSWVGHWVFPDYQKALGANLVVIPLPDFGAGTKSGQGSWAWGIGGSSSNGAAAGKFLDFLVSDRWVKAMTAANGAPPGTKSMYPKSALYKPGGKLYLYAQQLRATCGTKRPNRSCVATPRPITPAYPVITSEFSKAFWGAYKGGNAKALLNKAAKVIDLDYKDNDNYGQG
jgi:multiple sugar transport system substrate-binding protein